MGQGEIFNYIYLFVNTFNVSIIQNHFVDEKELYNLAECIFDIVILNNWNKVWILENCEIQIEKC